MNRQIGTNTKLNIMILSDYIPSPEKNGVLAKGLRFCPDSDTDKFEIIKDLHLFTRKLILKSLYTKNMQKKKT